uniref:Tyrosinase inhibitor n=1 Tax=Zeugodacus cucurbitae TaxID=28588 RepID=A0A0A1X839_ZEUCU
MFSISNSVKFLFFVVLCLAICDNTLGAQRKCAEYNEYCQEHWECCSNTCLTYSYRCIGKRRPGVLYERPSMTFEDLLESIAEVNMVQANAPTQSPNASAGKSKLALKNLLSARGEWGVAMSNPVIQERFAGVQMRSGNADPTSNGPDFIFFVLQPQEALRKPKQLEEQKTATAEAVPTETPLTVASPNVKADAEKAATADSELPATATRQCKAIGEKCYRHEECCTQRCHGFLHQCVT